MTFRAPQSAPESQIAEVQRGARVGRFCHGCGSTYPLHSARHQGKPVHGRDHLSYPCSHEGEEFAPGDDWWEPAVLVLPAPEPEAAEAADAS